MLRWVLSTVRNLDGHGGIFPIRHHLHVITARSLHGSGSPTVAPRRDRKPFSDLAVPPVTVSYEKQATSILAEHLSSADWPPPADTRPTLKFLYHHAKRTRRHSVLDARQFHRLLNLYGGLAARMNAKDGVLEDYMRRRESHWRFVLELGDDMEALGHPLRAQSQCYVLRALLFLEPTTPVDRRITTLYDQLKSKPTIATLQLHIAFLKVMISSRDPRVIRDIAFILQAQPSLPVDFLEILWSIILEPNVSSADHDHLLDAFLARVSLFVNANSHLPRTSTIDPTNTLDPITCSYTPPVIGIDHLCNALGCTIFPHLFVLVPADVRQWAIEQTRRALSADLPSSTRWNNFLCLAMIHSPPHLKSTVTPPSIDDTRPSDVVWRTVFMLATVRDFTVTHAVGEDSMEAISRVARLLWQQYERCADDHVPPPCVNRAIMSAFIHLAAYSEDTYLLDCIHGYITRHHLWSEGHAPTRNERVQLYALVVDYGLCSIICRRHSYTDLLLLFDIPELLSQKAAIVERLLAKITPTDVLRANDILHRCLDARLILPHKLMHAIGSRVAPLKPEGALRLLGRVNFSNAQASTLLLATIRGLYRRSIPQVSERLGKILVRDLARFRKVQCDPKPLQYALVVCARSGYLRETVDLVEQLAHSGTIEFDVKFLLKLGSVLLEGHRYRLLIRLWTATKGWEHEACIPFRRKMIIAMAHGRASSLARHAYRAGGGDLRERLLNRVRFRLHDPVRANSIRVYRFALRNRRHLPTLSLAMRILVRAKRPVAARRLYAACIPFLDVEARTHLGNILIHRPMEHVGTRNHQLLRVVLKHRDFLTKKYGFVEDRVTLHIIVKAILRWGTGMDAARLRILFDQIVRLGYPVDSRWRHGERDGVPFMTPKNAPLSFTLPEDMDPNVDFFRHTRPLYRMFIRAFYQRGDDEGARVVLSILKMEQAKMERREARRTKRGV